MSSLAETISRALMVVGPAAEGRLRDVVADFEELRLGEEERLAAVATAVAAAACNHHRRHRAIYLDAVRAWSLEVAGELEPEPPRVRFAADIERTAEGAEILISGIDSLIELMASMAVRTQDRLVTELALVARLLGQNDANTIHRALSAVERALSGRCFRPGMLVMVPLYDAPQLVRRDSDLEGLDPRGCA